MLLKYNTCRVDCQIFDVLCRRYVFSGFEIIAFTRVITGKVILFP
jgi:hypothetical protein